MTNAIYTINFWDSLTDAIGTTSIESCQEELRTVLGDHGLCSFFIVKSIYGQPHEDVTDEIFDAVCENEVDKAGDWEDVAEWAIGSPAYEERFGGYAPDHADRSDLAA